MKDIQGMIAVAQGVMTAVLEERNQARLKEIGQNMVEMYENTEALLSSLIRDAQECSKLLVEIVEDALRPDGEDAPKSRSIVDPAIRQAFDREMRKRLVIIPYRSEE